jgi:hypothetical protein
MKPQFIRRHSRANPEVADLYALVRELNKRAVTPATRDRFKRLMAMEPVLRLSVNLKHLLVECAMGPVRNWSTALSPEEREALCELERLGFSASLMEVAHGLLNIHERWSAMKATAKAFREARPLSDRRLDEKPLDGILG